VEKSERKNISKSRNEKLSADKKASGEDLLDVADEDLGPEVKELWEVSKADQIIGKLEDAGLETTVDEKKTVVCRVKSGSLEKDIFDVQGLLEVVKDEARSDSNIQRYKGLGEIILNSFGKQPWIPKKKTPPS